jgi:hypothetical protein
MMRLLMEAVMIIAIVSGMIFVSKMSASEDGGESKPKDTKTRDDDKDIKDDDWPYR